MSDIGVDSKEEVIIIDIESDIVDNNNINVAPRVGTGSDPLDGNGNDDAVVGGCKVWRCLVRRPSETSQRWASSIPS
jgi:hypothetical protein